MPVVAPAPADISLRAAHMQEFLARAGWGDATHFPLAGDASFRRYIRIRRGRKSAMVMDAPPQKETVQSYLSVARFLSHSGYSAPVILAEDTAQGFLLLEDLGDDLFTPLLAPVPPQADESTLYRAATALLAEWHTRQDMRAESASITLPCYDEALLLQEARLFSEWFLPAVAGAETARTMAAQYENLWRALPADAPLLAQVFVHRDYHASNLLWLSSRGGSGKVGLLDFQDAVWGDPAYDLVSLLEDARRDVLPQLASDMLAYYSEQTGCDAQTLLTAYALLGAQRNCKIIGIFTRLCVRDGKRHYLPLLPRVWGYLERDLQHPLLAPLRQWMDSRIPPAWRGDISAYV